MASEKEKPITDKEFADEVHMEIHAIRRIQGYKPNPAEIHISKFVVEKFAPTCKECKERLEKMKTAPVKEDSFLNKIFGEE